MPEVVENSGSAARDYCMLERNLLSHLRLSLLLFLLSCAVLLRAKLVAPVEDNGQEPIPDISKPRHGLPMATVQIVASLVGMAAGIWEYFYGLQNMRNMRTKLVGNKPHLGIITVIAGVVFSTCVILLANKNEL